MDVALARGPPRLRRRSRRWFTSFGGVHLPPRMRFSPQRPFTTATPPTHTRDGKRMTMGHAQRGVPTAALAGLLRDRAKPEPAECWAVASRVVGHMRLDSGSASAKS